MITVSGLKLVALTIFHKKTGRLNALNENKQAGDQQVKPQEIQEVIT